MSDEALGCSDNDAAVSQQMLGGNRALEMEPAEMLRDASLAKLAAHHQQDNVAHFYTGPEPEERGGTAVCNDPPIDLVVLDSTSAGERQNTEPHADDDGQPIIMEQLTQDYYEKNRTRTEMRDYKSMNEARERLQRRHSASNSRNKGQYSAYQQEQSS